MNLELLDPFRRQIPDRVDATLSLPIAFHYRKKKKKKGKDENDDEDWKAANCLAFNRRGTYIAVGYGSGTVGIFDVKSRTLSGVYRSIKVVEKAGKEAAAGGGEGEEKGKEEEEDVPTGPGVTNLSWSRRSRTLLAGAVGDDEVRIIDTTHPIGPEECCAGIVVETAKDNNAEGNRSHSPIPEHTSKSQPGDQSSFLTPKNSNHHYKDSRELKVTILPSSKDVNNLSERIEGRLSHIPVENSIWKRYPSLHFKLPSPLGTFLNIHPKFSSGGLATLSDGSLVAFWIPLEAWENNGQEGEEPFVKLATVYQNPDHSITCASFDTHGGRLYAGTNDGRMLGFELDCLFNHISGDSSTTIPQLDPTFNFQIPGGATIWDIVISRNGHHMLINSSDATIRLYTTKECWTAPEQVEKPAMTFQDVVSKVKFASCDMSGDAEYVVGGINKDDEKYELYIWSTSTGALMDKLTGAMIEISKVSWHPTRSFIAVAASDGLVDVWGPRINWTAFAPDFQALPQNVEYVECEDEFDVTETEKKEIEKTQEEDEQTENENVDVLTIEPVPVFASDSEDEGEVFFFDTKVARLLGGEKT